MRHRVSRLLAACIVFSAILHFTAGPLLVRLFGDRPVAGAQQPEIVYVATSSALRIMRRTHPLRARPEVRVPRHVTRNPAVRAARVRPTAAPRSEIARIEPRAATFQPTPRPSAQPTGAIALNVAAQEEQFDKTIARLREEQNPVMSAARAESAPEARRTFRYNFSGEIADRRNGNGILAPIRQWHDGPYDYYYVRYWVQYPDGTTETGLVPWPLRYFPSEDPFRLGLLHFPLPVPLPDYQLPADTDLHPLVAFCYEHRRQLHSCPIHHD